MPQNSTAYIAFGANLGNRRETFVRAAHMLIEQHPVTITACSDRYETSAIGGPADQPKYLNTVVAVRTDLTPHSLLAALLDIERHSGRRRTVRHGPRTLDLDLLLYENLIVDDEVLQLPHPRLHERQFVLQPLADIAPTIRHPLKRRSIQQLLDELQTAETIARSADPDWLMTRDSRFVVRSATGESPLRSENS